MITVGPVDMIIPIGSIERLTAGAERQDVVDRQRPGRMGAMVSDHHRADPAELSDVRGDDARAQALPLPSGVEGVVAAAVRLPGVCGAATAGLARDDTTDGAEFHYRSVSRAHPSVHSPLVLRLWDQPLSDGLQCRTLPRESPDHDDASGGREPLDSLQAPAGWEVPSSGVLRR